jgi:hypothetical protein
VRERVVGVDVLVKNDTSGDLLLQSPGDTDVALGSIPGSAGGCADNLSAESLEDGDLLAAHLLGEGDDGPVALDGADEGEANAGVAAGGLDEHAVSGSDAAFLLSGLDHAQGNAVLDGAAGVEELAFGVDLAVDAERLGDAVEADERGVADVLEDAVHDGGRLARGARCDVRHGGLCLCFCVLFETRQQEKVKRVVRVVRE